MSIRNNQDRIGVDPKEITADPVVSQEKNDIGYIQPTEVVELPTKGRYYPKDHILIAGNPGFYMVSANSYGEVKERLLRDTEKIISESYSLSK